jgi:hypothetical protein
MWKPVKVLEMPYKVGFYDSRLDVDAIVIVAMFFDRHAAEESARRTSETRLAPMEVFDQNDVRVASFTKGMTCQKFWGAAA